jgi:P-type conjugative transfer protein TrbJ
VFLPARKADAFLFDIILDPIALVEHVEQVAQLVQQVESVAQQITNQVHELAHLGDNVAPNIPVIVAGIQQHLNASIYNAANPGNQLESRYPADMSGATWDQYQSDKTTWTDDERQALIENRQIENQVYQDMDTTRQQVQGIVDASNAASGETAATQAHNDLLAVASGEFTKLQALKATRSRMTAEDQARQQSELSYAAAEQGRVLAGWNNPAPPTVTVVDPFQN